MPLVPGYAELHCWSNFSFLEGAAHPEELVARGAELGLAGIALTDRDGLYGTVRFTKAALAQPGFAAICGAELTLELPHPSRLVLLVENAAGYANLVELISIAQMRGSKRAARLHLDDLSGRTDGLVALSGWRNGLPERALLADDEHGAREIGAQLRDLFPGAFFLELQHHMRAEDGALCYALVRLARELGIPCVATNGAAYAVPRDARLCDILTCVKHKTSLAQAGVLLRPNAEFYLKSPAQMAALFSRHPQALRQTLAIAERCTFRLDKLRGQFPTFPLPPEEPSAHSYLRTLVYRGAAKRYGTPLASNVEHQLKRELDVIERMGLAGYFLIVWDIARKAAELGVLAQGRGSAASSAVCYALEITAVDPIAYNLLFERFLTEERNEVPDIDIDFAHQDREKVIQYVYERWGRAHAAMAAEVITYGTRSAIRDIGKALGLGLEQVEEIAREYDANESLSGETGAGELLLTYCRRIDGFPRHMGIHSGGMVITRDPLVRVAPIEWATMRDRSIVQWDKDDLNDLGLIKIDLLGLGMLSLLRDAFALHQRCYPDRAALTIDGIPADDEPTYEMMQRADTVGVFQIESRAQQSMLPRLRPRCFYDIVMQVAIIRPGPIQGDMIHPFLRRRNGQEDVTYLHPKLKPILERTLGVPLFQEQGMRMATAVAGFTPAEADNLRRAMGHKRSRERMREIYPRLVEGMMKNGITREAADRLYHMLDGFADYGFPESHAASFALLAYASAYVKCHEPAIFLAAILNVQPMGFYSTEVLVNDAKRHDVAVRPVTVNASEWWSFVEPDGAVRLGFHLIRGLGEAQRAALEAALNERPAFDDILDFARRSQLSREALENLAAADAFAPWFTTRREAMWALRGLDEREARGELGRGMEIDEPAARLRALAPLEATTLDIYTTGVSPQAQPISFFRSKLDALHVVSAQRLPEMPNHLICKVGGMVITRQRPGTAKGFVFLTLEDETGLVNVIIRPDVYEKYRRVIRLSNAVIVEGTLQKEMGCIDVLAKRIWSFDTEGAVDGVRARNFH
ncbi:MAG TPA: error-prone DNA polymerase [Candidatus Binatia bacterium]|nr:error-prone DNA polymerase [Candidatus Binatia bacterium]